MAVPILPPLLSDLPVEATSWAGFCILALGTEGPAVLIDGYRVMPHTPVCKGLLLHGAPTAPRRG